MFVFCSLRGAKHNDNRTVILVLIQRMRCIVWMVWLWCFFAAFAVQAADRRITTDAELKQYLTDTPQGQSPLDALSPGGRRRFLGELAFGRRGLGSVPLDDPSNELTHPQVVRLFALFGVEEFAQGSGISPERQARIQQERLADAAARGCGIKDCPESDIEKRYDQLVLVKPDFSLPDARRFLLDGQRYDRLFQSYQTPAKLRAVSSPDLRLLKRAGDRVVSYSPTASHLDDLRNDLDEMQQRHMAEDQDYAGLYQALVTSRQFANAETVARQHPALGVDAAPTLVTGSVLLKGQPTALSLDAQAHTMRREAFDLSQPLRIVIVASCHFSEDAARAVESDPQLRPLFAQHAIWLASQSEAFQSVAEWNRKLPDQPIHVAWQDSEWSMLDDWSMPTFYVFRHGRLAKKFRGWFDVQTLKQSLRDAGALR
ncbi:hypothetical protein HDE78_002770 [Rhodanobacter sp. K2T2]|uniref:hypothetical protein n=1 Tax=Rhodanobacter sp. K2T2 TaxID=2723085 RepID=UPI0015C91B82|nr:hypothetical protein [Rhodanobacter sp. K2T2]NYE29804.1 hypothetical protein [Rhodanobacter sp. K2T2]